MTTKFTQNLTTRLTNTVEPLPRPLIDWNQWDGSKDPASFVVHTDDRMRMVHLVPLDDSRFAVIETSDPDRADLAMRARIGQRVGNKIKFGPYLILPVPYRSTSGIVSNWMGFLVKIDDSRLFVVTRQSFGTMNYGIITYSGLEMTSISEATFWGTDSNLSYPVKLTDRKIMLFSYSNSNVRFNYRIITVSEAGDTFEGFTNGNIDNTTGNKNGDHATIRLEENKFAIASSHTNTGGSNARGGQVIVGELTDPINDTINVGSWFEFNNTRVDSISAIGINSGKFAIAYRDTGDLEQGVVVPVNYSGVTITGLGVAKEADTKLRFANAGGTRLGLIDNKYVFFCYVIDEDTNIQLSHLRALLNIYDISSGELVDVVTNKNISAIQVNQLIHAIEKIDDYTVIIAIHGLSPYYLEYKILSLISGKPGQKSWLKRDGSFDSDFQSIHPRSINRFSDILPIGNKKIISSWGSFTNTTIALMISFDDGNTIKITDVEELENASTPTNAKFVDLGNNLILMLFRKASNSDGFVTVIETSGDQIINKSASLLALTTATSFTDGSGNLILVGTNKALCVFANSDDLKASFINVTDIDNISETSQVVIGALAEYNNTGNETCAVCHKISNDEVLLVYTREVSGTKTDSIVLISTDGALPVINTIVDLAEHTTRIFRVISLSNDLYLIAAIGSDFPQTEITLYLVEKSGSSFTLRHNFLMPLGNKHFIHYGQFLTFDENENKVLFAAPVGNTNSIRFYSITVDLTLKQVTETEILGKDILLSVSSSSGFNAIAMNQDEIAVFCAATSPGTVAGLLRRN